MAELIFDLEDGLIDKEQYVISNINKTVITRYEKIFSKLEYRYDLQTLKAIYGRRSQCNHYNVLYANQMTEKYLSNIVYKKITSFETYIYYIFNYVYLLNNINLNKTPDVDEEILNFNNYIDQKAVDFFVDTYSIHDLIDQIHI